MKQKSRYVRGKLLSIIATITIVLLTKCVEAKRLIDEYPDAQVKEDESQQSKDSSILAELFTMDDPDVYEVPLPLDIMLATYNSKLNSTSVDDEEKNNEKSQSSELS